MKKILTLLPAAALFFPACRDCAGWVYRQDCPGGGWELNSDILMKDRRFLPTCSDSTLVYILGYDLDCELVLIDSI